MKKIKLAAASGYWGEPLDLPRELAEREELDYIGIELLAEVSMAILQRWKNKNPKVGYVPDLIEMMKLILPNTASKGTKIITNGGGTNPMQAGKEIKKLIEDMNLGPMKIAVIEGEDVKDKIDKLLDDGVVLSNLDTGEKDIRKIKDDIVAAHAYIGSEKIVEALKQGADIVIGGRLSDNALYVGPMMYEFGFDFDDLKMMGSAITIGHIVECGECSVGGMSNFWENNKEPWNMGMPIAEVSENGDAIIGMTRDSGGHVSENTIREHLVYEVHNPNEYIMPDGIGDLTKAMLQQVGPNKVKVTNMNGKARPEMLKVQVGYYDSWVAQAEILIPWPNALTKVKLQEKIIRKRLEKFKLEPLEINFEWVGLNSAHGVVAPIPEDEDTINEILLRISAKFKDRKDAETARRQCLMGSLIFAPVGAAFGVPTPVRRIVGLWPTLVPRDTVELKLTMLEAN